MADDNSVTNDVGSDNADQTAESFHKLDQRENEHELQLMVDALEHEKLSLINENQETKARVMQLEAEIESLRSQESNLKLRLGELEREIEESKEGKKVLDVIAHRAQQLENEVAKLQDDLDSATRAEEVANSDIFEMKILLGDKDASLEELRREKLEEENKIRDLERKIGDFEAKQVEERSYKAKEEEMRVKLDEKDKEIREYKKKLQSSEEKLREMEEKIVEMEKKVEDAVISIDGLKERTMEAVNGFEGQSIDRGTKGFKMDTPMFAAALTGVFLATAAALCLHYARRT